MGARLSGRWRPDLLAAPAVPAMPAVASVARYGEPRARARCIGPGSGPAPTRLSAGSFRLFAALARNAPGDGSPGSARSRGAQPEAPNLMMKARRVLISASGGCRAAHRNGNREARENGAEGWTEDRGLRATTTSSTSTTAISPKVGASTARATAGSAPFSSTATASTTSTSTTAMPSSSGDRVTAEGTGRGCVRSIGQPLGASAASTRCRVPRRTARPAATRARACRDTPKRLDSTESPSAFSRARRRSWV